MKKVLPRLPGAALALALLLALLLPGPDGSSTPVAGSRCGKSVQLDPWFESPLGRRAYVARAARHIQSPADVGRNLATGYVDITGLDGLSLGGLEVIDVDDLLLTDPELYRQLCLDERPDIKRFAVITKTNTIRKGHSEIRLLEELGYLGVKDPSRLFAVYTDRSPCSKCRVEVPKSARVYYAVVYKAKNFKEKLRNLLSRASNASKNDGAFQEETAREKERLEQRRPVVAERRREKARETSRVFRAGGGTCSLGLGPPAPHGIHPAALTSARTADCAEDNAPAVADNGLVRALAAPVEEAAGGIDFSSLELRYLSDPGDGSGLRYSFQAPTSDTGGTDPDTGVAAARLTSDAFFTWLELDPSAHWVNLNPSEPDRITDARLGRTDAGRVLLEADLQLKRDTGALLHPDTPTGRTFWDELRGGCALTRVWIVPAPARVRTEGDQLYILDAPLDVRMESVYRSDVPTSFPRPCPQADEATESHNERLFHDLVLPRLKKNVNSAPQYADLRRVYLARVAAEWYRDLSRSQDTAYGDLVGGEDVGPWATKSDWRPRDTFDAYVESATEGEFDIERQETRDGVVYRGMYFYGGVDLSAVTLRWESGGSFEARYGGMAEEVGASLRRPSADRASGALWLGSPTPREAAGPGPGDGGLSAGDLALRLLPVPLLLLAVLLLWRHRRRPAAAPAAAQATTPAAMSPLRRAATRARPRTQGDPHVVRPGRDRPDT